MDGFQEIVQRLGWMDILDPERHDGYALVHGAFDFTHDMPRLIGSRGQDQDEDPAAL